MCLFSFTIHFISINYLQASENLTMYFVNARNKYLTAKLLQQGYRYHRLRKTFSKYYHRHYELISKSNVGLNTRLHDGISEPEFYGNLVYTFKNLIGRNDFSFQLRKIITRYRQKGYNINVMQRSACLVFNPIMVDNFAAFFHCTPVSQTSDYMMLFILVDWDRSVLSVAWPIGFNWCFFLLRIFGAK